MILTILTRFTAHGNTNALPRALAKQTPHPRPRPMLRLLLLLLTTASLSAQQDTIYGDLNADGLPEMLVTVRHPEPLLDTLDGTETLETATVYRKQEGHWQPWPAAAGFLMNAYEEAGMSQFYPSIQRGTLVLVHGKPGYINWETTHRFRWQNGRFELIGYTRSFFERCAGDEVFDYNLSTGRYTYETKTWECDEDWNPKDPDAINYRHGSLPPQTGVHPSGSGRLPEFWSP